MLHMDSTVNNIISEVSIMCWAETLNPTTSITTVNSYDNTLASGTYPPVIVALLLCHWWKPVQTIKEKSTHLRHSHAKQCIITLHNSKFMVATHSYLPPFCPWLRWTISNKTKWETSRPQSSKLLNTDNRRSKICKSYTRHKNLSPHGTKQATMLTTDPLLWHIPTPSFLDAVVWHFSILIITQIIIIIIIITSLLKVIWEEGRIAAL